MLARTSLSGPHVQNAAGRGRHAGRVLAWVAAALGTLALLLAGLALAAFHTEWGARALWPLASRLAPGELSGTLSGGTLGSGLSLKDVAYQDDGRSIRLDSLETRWHWSAWPLALDVDTLRAGSADVSLPPSAPRPDTSPTLPDRLMLPLRIDVHGATLDHLAIHRNGESTRYSRISLRASSDGVQHALTLENAVTPYGSASAALRLEGRPPFALGGAASLSGSYRDERYRIDARLSGTLQALNIQLDASGDRLDGDATIDARPFAAIPIRSMRLAFRHLDPQAFNADWPHADLAIHAALAPTGALRGESGEKSGGDLTRLVVAGPVSLTNAQPGRLEQGLLPLVSANADVTLDARTQQFSGIDIRLSGRATLHGSGNFDKGEGRLALQARGLDLNALSAKLPRSALGGPLALRVAGERQFLDLKLDGAGLAFAATIERGPQQISLQQATLQAGKGRLQASGTLERDALAAYALTGTLTDFNPAALLRIMPPDSGKVRLPGDARINATFEAQGARQPVASAKVRFTVHDSVYDKRPMRGGGMLHIAGKRLLPSDAWLSIAGNKLALKGSFGAPSDRLSIDLDAPALDRLGFGMSGLARLNGVIGGTLARPVVDASYQAKQLAFGQLRVSRLEGEAHIDGMPDGMPDMHRESRADAKLVLHLSARGVRGGGVELGKLDADIDGSYARHTLRIDASGRLRGLPLELALAAQGRLRDQPHGMAWDGVLSTLENRGRPRISIASPLSLDLAPGRVDVGAGRLRIDRASIDLRSFHYSDRLIRSAGELSGLDVAELLALYQELTGESLPVSTSLVLDGRWNVTLGDSAEGFVRLARRSGDINTPDGRALGLEQLSLRADLQARQIQLGVEAQASRVGTASGQGRIDLQREDGRLAMTADSPITGRIDASIPRLQTLAALAGPRIALEGSVDVDLAVNGTLGRPSLSGAAVGRQLALTLYDQGIRLRDGSARLRMNENAIELQQVEFRGGDGSLRMTGRIPLDADSGQLKASLVADNLQLLAGPSRQLALSGQASASNAGGELRIDGRFIVDSARFSLPKKAAPKLGADVTVLRDGKVTMTGTGGPLERLRHAGGPLMPRLDIHIGLGNDFSFKGSGADLHLTGSLNVQSQPGETPQALGTVRVAKGSYEAFGTKLAIERGVIHFQGPIDNPSLNILAMRREQEVAAGVQVTGNVRQPHVELVSDPNLPKEQQLSWLIFGRSGGDGGIGQGAAQTVVAGAALGLLGGERLTKAFGLSALSVGESAAGLEGAQVVSLGKEISDRLYIGYEQSLAGAQGVLMLSYELARYWSVVAHGGSFTGLELLFSKRFDSIRRAGEQ